MTLIVALHGNAQNNSIWSEFHGNPNFLPKGLAGHQGEPSLRDYSFNSHAVHMAKKIMSPCCLMGHGLGAHIAIRIAKLQPELIQKLILTGMAPLRSFKDISTSIKLDSGSHILYQEDADFLEVQKFYKKQQKDINITKIEPLKMWGQQDPRHRTSLKESFLDGIDNEVELIQSLEIPVSIVIGEQDSIINRDYLDSLGLEYSLIKDSGHNIMIDQPLELSKYI